MGFPNEESMEGCRQVMKMTKTTDLLKKGLFVGAAAGFLTAGGYMVRAAETAAPPAPPAGAKTAAPGTDAQAGDKAKPLAAIGDRTITVGDLENRINQQIPFVRKRYANEDEKKKFLDATVDFEVLAMEARKQGLDKNPEVLEAAKRVMIHRQRQLVIESRVTLEQITDDEVKDYYDKHIVEFQRPERRRVGIVVVADEEKAKQVRAEVDKAAGDLRAFQEIVKNNSIDEESKNRSGLLPFFEKEDKNIEKAIVDATFAMTKAGDVAGPIKVAKGWAVLRMSGISPAVDKKLEEVKDQLKRRILTDRQQKEFQKYIEELRAKANIKIYKDKLALIKVDTTTQPGPGADFGLPGQPGPIVPGPGRMGPGPRMQLPPPPAPGAINPPAPGAANPAPGAANPPAPGAINPPPPPVSPMN